MKINNREYGFTIEPYSGRVFVEIYKISAPLTKLANKDIHINLISRKFGKWYRKPIKSDYEKARDWAKYQMQCILDANK